MEQDICIVQIRNFVWRSRLFLFAIYDNDCCSSFSLCRLNWFSNQLLIFFFDFQCMGFFRLLCRWHLHELLSLSWIVVTFLGWCQFFFLLLHSCFFSFLTIFGCCGILGWSLVVFVIVDFYHQLCRCETSVE